MSIGGYRKAERWIIRMKKTLFVIISLIVLIFNVICVYKIYTNKNYLKSNTIDASVEKADTDELSICLDKYKLFLQNKICSQSKDGENDESHFLKDFCNVIPSGKWADEIQYALFDMTGDGVPELHVRTNISYSIHSIKNDDLVTWYEGDRYRKPLNNREILETVESTGISYYYEILDTEGNQVLGIGFSQRPGKYQKYLYDTGNGDVELSKKDWKKLTKAFLSIGSDKIVWKNINEMNV